LGLFDERGGREKAGAGRQARSPLRRGLVEKRQARAGEGPVRAVVVEPRARPERPFRGKRDLVLREDARRRKRVVEPGEVAGVVPPCRSSTMTPTVAKTEWPRPSSQKRRGRKTPRKNPGRSDQPSESRSCRRCP